MSDGAEGSVHPMWVNLPVACTALRCPGSCMTSGLKPLLPDKSFKPEWTTRLADRIS